MLKLLYLTAKSWWNNCGSPLTMPRGQLLPPYATEISRFQIIKSNHYTWHKIDSPDNASIRFMQFHNIESNPLTPEKGIKSPDIAVSRFKSPVSSALNGTHFTPLLHSINGIQTSQQPLHVAHQANITPRPQPAPARTVLEKYFFHSICIRFGRHTGIFYHPLAFDSNPPSGVCKSIRYLALVVFIGIRC